MCHQLVYYEAVNSSTWEVFDTLAGGEIQPPAARFPAGYLAASVALQLRPGAGFQVQLAVIPSGRVPGFTVRHSEGSGALPWAAPGKRPAQFGVRRNQLDRGLITWLLADSSRE